MSLGKRVAALVLASSVDASLGATLEMGAPLGVSWGPLYGFPPHGAEAFMPQARAIGASFGRITLYWSQLEPQPGQRRWDELDAYLAQLSDADEGFLTIASASPWATRVPAQVFPSSPAKAVDDYRAFVRAVVAHAHGRIRYFQSDPEPNNPFFWRGSAEDFVEEQMVFYQAVKDVDPAAVVVLGACDGLFEPTGVHPLPGQAADLAFFSSVIAGAAGAYDVFDLRLYADPYTIPDRVRFVRDAMAKAGAVRPIVATEYDGPGFFEFAANRRLAPTVMNPATAAETVRDLVASSSTLPIETRMFLPGADPADAARLQSLAADDLIVRNVLALASGVQRTAYFDLWHERGAAPVANDLLFGSFRLMERKAGALAALPIADAFRRLARFIDGARSIERVPVDGQPDAFVFAVVAPPHPPRWIAWRRPAAPGADVEPLTVAAPWSRRGTDQSTDAVTFGASPAFIER